MGKLHGLSTLHINMNTKYNKICIQHTLVPFNRKASPTAVFMTRSVTSEQKLSTQNAQEHEEQTDQWKRIKYFNSNLLGSDNGIQLYWSNLFSLDFIQHLTFKVILCFRSWVCFCLKIKKKVPSLLGPKIRYSQSLGTERLSTSTKYKKYIYILVCKSNLSRMSQNFVCVYSPFTHRLQIC